MIQQREQRYGKFFFAYFDFVYPKVAEQLSQAAEQHCFRFLELSHLFTQGEIFQDHIHFTISQAGESLQNKKIAEVLAQEIVDLELK